MILGADFSGCRYVSRNRFLYWQRCVETRALRLPLAVGSRCPFGGPLWQIWVNHTLAHALAARFQATHAVYAVCAPRENEQLGAQEAVSDFRQLATDPSTVVFLPLEELLPQLLTLTAGRAGWHDWAATLQQRYSLPTTTIPPAPSTKPAAAPTPASPVTNGHRQVVRWMRTPAFRELVAAHREVCGQAMSIYFRPTDKGLVRIALHPKAPGYVGFSANSGDGTHLVRPGGFIPGAAAIDLLTSNVFGLLQYAPPDVALLPWFAMAANPLDGQKLADWLPPGTTLEQCKFWPTLSAHGCTPCEPDVSLILKRPDGQRLWLLVEAKYRSDKSSFASDAETPPHDQLAREYDNLSYLAPSRDITRFAVLFVTADITCPTEELQASADELSAKRQRTPDLFWLSWRTLPEILAEAATSHPMLADLRALLLRMDLTMYRRLRLPVPLCGTWHFVRQRRGWRWAADAPSWRFAAPAAARAASASPAGSTPATFRFSLPSNPQRYYRWRQP